jgi:hypothetical protein
MALSGSWYPQVEIATLIACDTTPLLEAEPEPDDGDPVVIWAGED